MSGPVDLDIYSSSWAFSPDPKSSERGLATEADLIRSNRWIILPGAEARVGVDDPEDSPWHGLVMIDVGFGASLVRRGTGFYCGQDVIVTAGHNLMPRNYDRGTVLRAFDSRRNNNQAPLTVRAHAVHHLLDLAILIVDEPPPSFFDMDGTSNSPPSSLTLAGYSHAYEDGLPRLTKARGAAGYFGKDMVGYRINTRFADSGAPVFKMAGNRAVAVGVHTEAPTGSADLNAGIRLTQSVIQEVGKLVDSARAEIQ